MKFGLTQEISEDICTKGKILTEMANSMKEFFIDKSYGNGLNELYVGIVCVAPQFEFFFKHKQKYTKSKKLIEYDVKLEHASFAQADDINIKKMVANGVINSLGILTELKVIDFNLEAFKADITSFFTEQGLIS